MLFFLNPLHKGMPLGENLYLCRPPFLIVTDPNALAMPPKIDAKEAAGYGLYLAKQTLHGRLLESVV